MNKVFLALLCVFAVSVNAQTPVSQLDKDTMVLFNQFYKPLLDKVIFCTAAKNPTLTAMEKCVETAKTWGTRFPTVKESDEEALESARLHANLMRGNWKIVDDAATDPWTSWRCLAPSCNMGTNKEIVAKSTVRSYVVDETGKVYDHRMRYFIRPDWAKALGKVNTMYGEIFWNKKKTAINAKLKAQAPK